MKHLNQRCEAVGSPCAYLDMTFDERQKARSRVVASNGEMVGVHIERGTSLRDGEALKTVEGEVFVVRARRESLSIVRCDSPTDLARAAYHLGNRHIRLQVAEKALSYQVDHVLDEMLEHFGLTVEHAVAAFEPEPGAYHRHGNTEGASHSHGHGQAHSHGHSHTDESVETERSSPSQSPESHGHVHSH